MQTMCHPITINERWISWVDEFNFDSNVANIGRKKQTQREIHMGTTPQDTL